MIPEKDIEAWIDKAYDKVNSLIPYSEYSGVELIDKEDALYEIDEIKRSLYAYKPEPLNKQFTEALQELPDEQKKKVVNYLVEIYKTAKEEGYKEALKTLEDDRK